MFTGIIEGKELISIKLDDFDEMPFLRRCWLASQCDDNSRILSNRKGKVIGLLELIKKVSRYLDGLRPCIYCM